MMISSEKLWIENCSQAVSIQAAPNYDGSNDEET